MAFNLQMCECCKRDTEDLVPAVNTAVTDGDERHRKSSSTLPKQLGAPHKAFARI
jgi:hypothetical protein